MTREEAMKWLKHCAFSICEECEHEVMPIEWCDQKMQEAVMAIEALTSQNLTEPNNTCGADLISRADAIEALRGLFDMRKSRAKVIVECFSQLVEELPSAEYSKPLQTTLNGDLISRADAIEAVQDHFNADGFKGYFDGQKMMDRITALPSADAEWIPFTRRPMTEEEQKDYPNCTFIFDCVLPDDGDEILVSNGRYVWMDTFCTDIDGCYLDGGDDIDEDMAWMPLPKPYREESEA